MLSGRKRQWTRTETSALGELTNGAQRISGSDLQVLAKVLQKALQTGGSVREAIRREHDGARGRGRQKENGNRVMAAGKVRERHFNPQWGSNAIWIFIFFFLNLTKRARLKSSIPP